jgi:AraC family transcriptional regulator, regulatory protein of adaptative response / methylated-DNA-[protein]-cysteine methyltransferase
MECRSTVSGLPPREVLYRALVEKDSEFDGRFVAGVVTTGVFCRPTCGARKPKPENVEYFASASDALHHGYRPCKLCNPLAVPGATPPWLQPLLDEVHADPQRRWKDRDMRAQGLDPDRVRRWFRKHHGMTFHAYGRALRLATAFGRLESGNGVAECAYGAGYESLSGFAEAFAKTTGRSPGQGRTLALIRIARVLTPLGPMIAGVTNEGVCLLEFADRRMVETQLRRIQRALGAHALPGSSPHIALLEQELAEYFAGTRRAFTVPLVTAGTPFQERVWQALQEIPCGETRSYQDQANAIGRPTAVRAVARANGDNRIAILIPCHRVIGKDGELVGYGGGLWRKRHLLDLERHSANGVQRAA